VGDKTSETYISPLHYRFCDPKDIENGCDCTKTNSIYECGAEKDCEKAGGKCHVVIAGPGEPQLNMPKHDNPAGHERADLELPPGWEAFCACLKHTGKDPTDEEKKTWPKATQWKAPKDYKLPENAKPCGMPIKTNNQFGLGAGDWTCPDKDCYLVGVEKDGQTQLVKIADPGGKVRPKDVSGYASIFCIHLDKV